MSQSGIYSELKPAWWAAREGLKWPEAPKQVQLILSDLCSHDCKWCAYRTSGYSSNELFTTGAELSKFGHANPIRFMPTERAMSLLDEFKDLGVLGVQYTGGGESTLHRDHAAVYEKTLAIGLRAALVSNGDSWSPRLASEILPRFDWVRVSIDAGTPETYAETRGISPLRWDRVWGHVRQLAESIRMAGTPTTLGIGFVVAPGSWKEIGECCRIAKEAGAEYVRLSAIFSPEDEKPYVPIYDEIVALIAETKTKYDGGGFYVADNFGSRIADMKLGNPDYKTCGYMRYTTYVGADHNNYVCCVYSYNSRGKMASIKDRSFSEWWRSEERKKFMEEFDARGCERCQFNERNKQLNYIRGTIESGEVKHMEWT
jgi:MoaA/NifB/PqqE/SkfB family radical SAM enzyme